MGTKHDIGLEQALSQMLDRVTRLAPVDLSVDRAGGLVAADDCIAKVDCPSASTSLKDGHAVVSADLENACRDRAVRLKVCGSSFAGGGAGATVKSGTAVKIMTGARIPPGADAVIANEFTEEEGDSVLCYRDAGVQRNILKQGYDVTKGERIIPCGELIAPAMTGLLAAGGACRRFGLSEAEGGHHCHRRRSSCARHTAKARTTLRQQSRNAALMAQAFSNGSRGCSGGGPDRGPFENYRGHVRTRRCCAHKRRSLEER